MGLNINKEVIESQLGENFMPLHMSSGVHFRFGNACFSITRSAHIYNIFV